MPNMENTQKESRRWFKLFGKIAGVTLAVLALFLILCPVFGIHVFVFGLGGDATDRIDCIEDYYVAVYCHDLCYFRENENDHLIFGYADDVTDYEWKHREVFALIPYRRVLCFSKETENETYYLTDETGKVRYGMMYVLRTAGDQIHYYYRRCFPDERLEFPTLLYEEQITFSCDGAEYDLTNFTYFSATTDFTTNDRVLQLNGEPCYFKTLD